MSQSHVHREWCTLTKETKMKFKNSEILVSGEILAVSQPGLDRAFPGELLLHVDGIKEPVQIDTTSMSINFNHPRLFYIATADGNYYVIPNQEHQKMLNDSKTVEERIQELKLTAPRITPEHIVNTIIKTQYYIFPGTQTTVCCLVLKNGFTVIGKSACASPANFNSEIGEKIAYEDAVRQIGSLEGYLLREALYQVGE